MPAPHWEDRDAFLDADEFAVEAVIALAGGGTRTVRAIFDDPYEGPELGALQLDSTGPRLTAKEEDFAGVTRGDTATVAGIVYDVMGGGRGDGTGMSTLPLAPRHSGGA